VPVVGATAASRLSQKEVRDLILPKGRLCRELVAPLTRNKLALRAL
jgi:hypothetical protein